VLDALPALLLPLGGLHDLPVDPLIRLGPPWQRVHGQTPQPLEFRPRRKDEEGGLGRVQPGAARAVPAREHDAIPRICDEVTIKPRKSPMVMMKKWRRFAGTPGKSRARNGVSSSRRRTELRRATPARRRTAALPRLRAGSGHSPHASWHPEPSIPPRRGPYTAKPSHPSSSHRSLSRASFRSQSPANVGASASGRSNART